MGGWRPRWERRHKFSANERDDWHRPAHSEWFEAHFVGKQAPGVKGISGAARQGRLRSWVAIRATLDRPRAGEDAHGDDGGGEMRQVLGVGAFVALGAAVAAFVVGELVLVHHGGSCSNGAVSIPRNRCTPTTYRAGGLMGAGIVVMVLAALVVAFTLGPTLMFVGLGAGFLAGSLSVLASGTSQLVALIVVWGLIGVTFLVIGGFGLRSERRERAATLSWPG